MSDLPAGWEWTRIEDLRAGSPHALAIGPFGSDLKVEDYKLSGVPLIFVRHIRARDVEGLAPKFIDERKAEELSAHLVQPGDVLVTKMGEPPCDATVYRGQSAAVLTADCIKLTPHDKVSADYLAYLIEAPQFRALVRTITQGVAQKKVSLGRFRNLPIPVAPAGEQKRIVAAIEQHLSRLDAAHSLLATAEERVGHLARVSIRQLLGSQSWAWTTLGAIAAIKGGVTKDSKRQADPSFVEVPYLRVANVQRGRLDLREVTTIRVPPATSKALRLEPGDVLLNEGGDRDKLGRGWVWEGQIENCIHQNHVFRARLSDDFDPYFVSTHANTWGQAWFEEHGRQTTNLASINLGTLKQLPVPAPPRAEQEAVVVELRKTDDARQRLTTSIEQARKRAASLRRSILAAAFAGQLVPQDPEDEPASVMIERIRAERAAAPIRRGRTRAAKQ